jgi:hypothetical protein
VIVLMYRTRREFFFLLSHEMFEPNFALFEYSAVSLPFFTA